MFRMLPLRGAPADLLQTIVESIAAGNDQPSMLDLAVESGYSLSTVQRAIRLLQDQNLIAIETGGGCRAHRYTVLEQPARTSRRIELPMAFIAGLSVALGAFGGIIAGVLPC